MTMINKILVPVDGSELSKKALNYAKEIAEKFNGEITVLHVFEIPVPVTGYEFSSDILANIEEDLKKGAKEILKDSVDQIFKPEIKINELMLVGNQGYQIADTAEKNNFDLIVMGSRGLGAIKSFLLGSVSNFVLHHTKVPVMLIH
jgi:nucleotide-binding universal stress UspA family protein